MVTHPMNKITQNNNLKPDFVAIFNQTWRIECQTLYVNGEATHNVSFLGFLGDVVHACDISEVPAEGIVNWSRDNCQRLLKDRLAQCPDYFLDLHLEGLDVYLDNRLVETFPFNASEIEAIKRIITDYNASYADAVAYEDRKEIL